MNSLRRLLCLLAVTAGVIGGSAVPVLASPASTPPATPGTPGCGGLIVAFENHDSGPNGASGNSTSSAGPGYFLGSDSAGAITDVRATFCT